MAALLYAAVIERDRLLLALGVTTIAPGDPAAETGGAAPPPGAGPDRAENGADDGDAAIRVLARHSRAEEVDSAVTLRGEAQPSREVEVLAETTGRVVSPPLRKGARVSAGDVLCELAPGTREITLAEAEAALAEARAAVPEAEARVPEAEARVAEAEAALEEARINANAAQELSGSGYASETRVAGTRAAVRAAEAGLSSARAGLEAA
ncbi:efflux RND transporter periplasmic adaptor subunit, partial [Roseivivax sp. CAU 1761]